MKRASVLTILTGILASAFCVAFIGCNDQPYYAAPPPPPPPVAYAPAAALLDLANRNGFQLGVDDGARDAYYGYVYAPRRTHAYHEAPGYNPSLGPIAPYVNTFRNSYLAGYDKGFYRR